MEQPIFKFALREDLQSDKQFLPTRAEPQASGWDVRAALMDRQSVTLLPFDHIKIPLGFRSFCPEGWWYELKPRSSTFAKKHLHSLYGTIDQNFEGELVFACQYLPPLRKGQLLIGSNYLFSDFMMKNQLEIKFGEAIGQLIPKRREEMQVIEVSNQEYEQLCQQRAGIRGSGGFGSTDQGKI